MTITKARHKQHKSLTNNSLKQNTKSLYMPTKINYKEMNMTKHLVKLKRLHTILQRENTHYNKEQVV